MRRSIPEKGKQSRSGYDQDEISHLGQSKGSDQAAYDSVPEPHQAPQEVVQREPMVSEQSAVTSSSITSTQKAPPAARSAPAQEPLDQAQVSLNRVIRLWGEGERKTALKALMKWLDENPSHAQRGNVLRLGISWAQELNDQEALSQLQPRTGSSPKAKKKRQQSMPQADESSGKDIMGY